MPTTLLAALAGQPGAGDAHAIAWLALALAILLVVAKVAGDLAVRVGQLTVLGELLAGVMLGNVPGLGWLGWLRDDPAIDVLAQLGSLVLLFEVGLALTVRDVFAVGGAAAAVAALGTAFSFVFGWLAIGALRPEDGPYVHTFVAAALTATSIGITARVLRDLSQAKAREARIILGAAVLDDVIGLMVLAIVAGSIAFATGRHGAPSLASVGWVVLKALAFFAAAFAVGIPLSPWVFRAAASLRTSGAHVAVGLAFCLVLAWAADALGLAPIVGAFTAGLILEEAHSAGFVARGERSLAELVEPVSSFLVPVFFVIMGMRVNVRSLVHPGALALAAALTTAAVLGKAACGLGATRARRLAVAAGMLPRGEVTLIYASLGSTTLLAGKPVLDSELYSALVFVIVATTLLTPPALTWALQPPHRG
jgi:Kef-type K+ transport system membrane component KefB